MQTSLQKARTIQTVLLSTKWILKVLHLTANKILLGLVIALCGKNNNKKNTKKVTDRNLDLDTNALSRSYLNKQVIVYVPNIEKLLEYPILKNYFSQIAIIPRKCRQQDTCWKWGAGTIPPPGIVLTVSSITFPFSWGRASICWANLQEKLRKKSCGNPDKRDNQWNELRCWQCTETSLKDIF